MAPEPVIDRERVDSFLRLMTDISNELRRIREVIERGEEEEEE